MPTAQELQSMGFTNLSPATSPGASAPSSSYSPNDLASMGFVPLNGNPSSTISTTQPNIKPVPGSETAVMPAQPADGSARASDIPKVIPNALGDVWNLIKEGTIGTAENILKIPGEAASLIKEQGVGSAIKNTVKSIPEAVGKTVSALVPQSAKEIANTDAISQIPDQFKELVKQNGGSYANALLTAIKAIPGAIPDAVQNYANQIDRARQAVENHPVNEFLGWMGLKALGANKVTLPENSSLNKNVSDIPGDTLKAIPGSAIPGKMVRRVGDAINSTKELSQQPEQIKTAVKADIPQPQAELINQANPQEKAVMKQMLNLQKEGVKKMVMNPEERPDAKIGQQVVNMVKFLQNQAKSAQIIEGEHVKNLSNSSVDYSETAKNFLDKLNQLQIRVRAPEEMLTEKGKVGPLDFSKSELDGPSSAKDRGLLEMTYNKLKPDENGNFIKPANELHTTRQSLFNETQNKNFTEPFSNKIVNIVHNDQGNSVRSGLLHDISGQAGETGKGYESTVTKNAKIQTTLQTIGKLMGKNSGATDLNIQNLRAGEVANRIAGNASANVENALQKLEDTAKEYGFKSNVSVRKLVAFKTILKNIVGETQSNSLAGGVEQGVKAALPDAIDVAGQAHSGNIVGAIKAVGKFVKGNTRAEQVRALENLLSTDYKEPAFTAQVTKTVPELIGIKPENIDKLKTFMGLGKKAAERAGMGDEYNKILEHISSSESTPTAPVKKNNIDPDLGF